MSTCYRYRDMNGVLADTVRLAVYDKGKNHSALSDKNGVVRFEETFSDEAQVLPIGFGTAVKIPCYEPPPPAAPGPGEESIGRIGTSCSIIRNTSFGQSFFQIRHDRSGNVTSLHSDLPEVRGIGNRTAACFEIPPPPPKTTDELGGEVSTLQKLLNGAVGKIDNLVQGLADIAGKVEIEAADRLKGLLDLEARIKTWIVDGILDIIWAALTQEHKGA